MEDRIHRRRVKHSRTSLGVAAEPGPRRTAKAHRGETRSCAVTIEAMTPNQPGQMPKLPIPGVKNLIAVGSGKGRVGKTTASANLDVGLSRVGHTAGLIDADVYGPNVPHMMGLNRTPMAYGERIQPLD